MSQYWLQGFTLLGSWSRVRLSPLLQSEKKVGKELRGRDKLQNEKGDEEKEIPKIAI